MTYISNVKVNLEDWVKASNINEWKKGATNLTKTFTGYANNPKEVERKKVEPIISAFITALHSPTLDRPRMPAFWLIGNETPEIQVLRNAFIQCEHPDANRVVRLLEEKINTPLSTQDAMGKTALHHAIQNHQDGILRSLLHRNDLALAINTVDYEGNTPLLLALKMGRYDFAMDLLNFGASISTQDAMGKTALHYAIQNHQGGLLSYLLHRNDLALAINTVDDEGNTPLILALKERRDDFAMGLLNRGASVATQGIMGKTALHYAIENSQEVILDPLLHGNDLALAINTFDDAGNTPLLLALKVGRDGFAKKLLDSGASVDSQNLRGNTILHELVILRNYEACEFILNYNPDLRLKNNDGDTSFALAWYLNYSWIALLITKSAPALNLYRQQLLTPMEHEVMLKIIKHTSLTTVEHFFNEFPDLAKSESTLRMAYDAKRPDVFKSALRRGADPNSQEACLILTSACYRNQRRYVDALLEAGIRLDNFDKTSQMLVISALKFNRIPLGHLPPERRHLSDKILSEHKLFMRGKSIAHSSQIRAKLTTDQYSFRLEGGKDVRWAKVMADATGLFGEHFREIIPAPIIALIVNTLRRFEQNNATTDLLDIQQGLPVIKSSGWLSHSVSMTFWNPFGIVVNRGSENWGFPLIISEFQRELLKEEHLERITRVSHSELSNDYVKLISELPGKLNFRPTEETAFLANNCTLPEQVMGNCSWASLEGAVWVILVISATQGMNASGQLTALNADVSPKTMGELKYAFDLWLAFNQLYHIEKYFDTRVIRPDSFKKPVILPPIPFLFDEAFAKIKPFANSKSPYFHPHMRELYKRIRARYKDLKIQVPPNLFTLKG